MATAHEDVSIVRMRGSAVSPGVDHVATEEPLEVRLHGEPFAVIMRTPGADRELAAGFLFAEGVLLSADDLGTIEHCTDVRLKPDTTSEVRLKPDTTSEILKADHPSEIRLKPDPTAPTATPVRASAENVINVTLSGRSRAALDEVLANRRRVMGNASCGMCGRLTIDSLISRAAPLPPGRGTAREILLHCPAKLRASQRTFDETGGIHAAGLFRLDGELIESAEDVGRHNAVDKIVGRALMLDRLPLSNAILFVSGRTSFEIVQKAFLAGIPLLGAVSAPSSLAVELARTAGLTLLGFVRDNSFNIYTHPERIT